MWVVSSRNSILAIEAHDKKEMRRAHLTMPSSPTKEVFRRCHFFDTTALYRHVLLPTLWLPRTNIPPPPPFNTEQQLDLLTLAASEPAADHVGSEASRDVTGIKGAAGKIGRLAELVGSGEGQSVHNGEDEGDDNEG